MRFSGHVASSGDTRSTFNILAKKLKGRHYLGDVGIDGLIKADWILKGGVREQIGNNWLQIRSSCGLCKHGNEYPGYIKCGEFLTSCTNSNSAVRRYLV
jgi:hypothetical protein